MTQATIRAFENNDLRHRLRAADKEKVSSRTAYAAAN